MRTPSRTAQPRFGALFRAELTARSGSVIAGCFATVITLAVAVGTTNVRGVAPIQMAAEPMRRSVPPVSPSLAPGDADGWLGSARRAAATTCPGLPPEVLVAIGKLESGLGTRTARSPAGAVGPMQFMPSTWAAYGSDGDGDGIADVMNPPNALHGAARLLCANGGGDPARLRSAIWNYNRSNDYVDRVARMAGLTS